MLFLGFRICKLVVGNGRLIKLGLNVLFGFRVCIGVVLVMLYIL